MKLYANENLLHKRFVQEYHWQAFQLFQNFEPELLNFYKPSKVFKVISKK